MVWVSGVRWDVSPPQGFWSRPRPPLDCPSHRAPAGPRRPDLSTNPSASSPKGPVPGFPHPGHRLRSTSVVRGPSDTPLPGLSLRGCRHRTSAGRDGTGGRRPVEACLGRRPTKGVPVLPYFRPSLVDPTLWFVSVDALLWSHTSDDHCNRLRVAGPPPSTKRERSCQVPVE